MTPDEPLNTRQARAIEALLTSDSREAAATASGVSVRTLQRWALLPAFASAMRRARARMVDNAASVLAGGAVAAARSLVQMATTQGRRRVDPARVAAAKAVLDQAGAFVVNQDFTARLDALERIAAARSASPASQSLPS
jgi:hypothetical protein